MKNISLIKNEARAALKGHWGIAIGVFLLMLVINGALNMVAPFDATTESTGNTILSFMSVLVTIFVSVPLATGFQWFYLSLFDGESLSVKKMFSAFGKGFYLKVIWANILVGIMVFIWTLPAVLIGILVVVLGISEVMSLWLLIIPIILLILPVMKAYSYTQTFFLIKDNPTIPAWDAIKTSKKIMSGKRMKLFLTELSFIGWVILPFVIGLYGGWLVLRAFLENSGNPGVGLGIGLLFVVLALFIGMIVCIYLAPYYQTTVASFYRMLQPKEVIVEEVIIENDSYVEEVSTSDNNTDETHR